MNLKIKQIKKLIMSWENAHCHPEKASVNGQPRVLLSLTVGLVEIVTDIGKVFDICRILVNRISRNRPST